MRAVKAILATTLFAAVASSGAIAQAQMYTDPDKCVAEISALDTNRDGFVDNNEMSAYGRVETNVDTNNDGRISNDEKVVACKNGVMRALKPHSG